jgi:hypothetical protein
MSFPIYESVEWQCRHVFPDQRCCIRQEGHDGEHRPATLESASSTPRVPLSDQGTVIGSAPDRASLRSSVEALIAQWRYAANYLAVTTTMDIGATNAQIRTLQHCADQLEALLRSSVREGAAQDVHEEESCAPADGIPSGSDRISAQATETLRTLTERAAWYRDGCDGLEDRDGYYASGDCARDAASDLETALSEIRVLESVIARLRSNHV